MGVQWYHGRRMACGGYREHLEQIVHRRGQESRNVDLGSVDVDFVGVDQLKILEVEPCLLRRDQGFAQLGKHR